MVLHCHTIIMDEPSLPLSRDGHCKGPSESGSIGTRRSSATEGGAAEIAASTSTSTSTSKPDYPGLVHLRTPVIAVVTWE